MTMFPDTCRVWVLDEGGLPGIRGLRQDDGGDDIGQHFLRKFRGQ